MKIDLDKLKANKPGTVPEDALLISRDQLSEMLASVADEAYEVAAKVCDAETGPDATGDCCRHTAQYAASKIRGLKGF